MAHFLIILDPGPGTNHHFRPEISSQIRLSSPVLRRIFMTFLRLDAQVASSTPPDARGLMIE